jgi:hypothetical protein
MYEAKYGCAAQALFVVLGLTPSILLGIRASAV